MNEFCREEWRPVRGWEGLEVSDKGNCRRPDRVVSSGLNRKRLVKGRFLKASLQSSGYYSIAIWNPAKASTQTLFIHQLVAEAFIGPRPLNAVVRHLNGVPTDNRLCNLAYGTHQDNVNDSIRHGTWVHGEKQGQSKLTSDQVRAIRADTRSSRAIAADYPVNRSVVTAIKNRRAWAHLP